MALDDLGSDPDPAHELLLGQEQVRVAPVQLPDPVQQAELGRGIEAEIADELSDVGPVLLLNVSPVVLVAGSRPGEGDLALGALLEKVGIDELGSVIRVDAQDREREALRRVVIASVTQTAAMFRTERFTAHPLATSVMVRVKQNSPKEFPPSWPTRSISQKPGTPSSHSDQVRTGIWDLRGSRAWCGSVPAARPRTWPR
jgi:hypothetical protein